MARSIEEALRVLGVAADSDPATVAHAYRRLARATHPDVSPDPDATHRFATVAAAYRLVAGPRSRAAHAGRTAAPAPASTGSSPIDLPGHARLYGRGFATTRRSDPGPDGAALGASPVAPARPWRRPPILAAPCWFAARPNRAPSRSERDG